MGYGRALQNAGLNAAKTFAKATPLGGIISGVSSLFGGGVDHRARSLKKLKQAAKRGDMETVIRKAANSKYKRVRGLADILIQQANGVGGDASGMDFAGAKVVYARDKAARGAPVGGAGPMPALPVLRADPVTPAVAMPSRVGSTTPRRRRRKRRTSTRRRTTRTRGRARRLKFGSPAWQRKYNPRRRRRRR